MANKLSCLIEFRRVCEELTSDGLLEVIKHLVEQDCSNLIIAGLFQQLYAEGESNNHQFYQNLLTVCRNHAQLHTQNKANTSPKIIITSNSDGVNQHIVVPPCFECYGNCNQILTNHFSNLPDSLFCNIACYLDPNDILCKWNHVNRKFIQIGLKPESFTQFKFTKNRNNTYDKLEQYSPKFKLDYTLSKIVSITYDSDMDDGNKLAQQIVNEMPTKSVKSFALGMWFVILFINDKTFSL